MQTIGERLEEARKRKGISLREASEATKIRSDFLSAIEQNMFDYDLPDIYKRGFLKNYARYLKLDPEKILTDYHTQLEASSRANKKSGAEWFGKMELKSAAQEQAEATAEIEEPSFGRISSKPKTNVEDPAVPVEQEEESDQTFYLKAGLIFVGTIAVILVLFGLGKALIGSSQDDTPPVITAPEGENADSSDNTPTEVVSEETTIMTLEATGTVYVIVKNKGSNEELFKGTLAAGDTADVEKSGAVEVLFTAGENLIVINKGERMRPEGSGTAIITID